jgi:hypothetical protein
MITQMLPDRALAIIRFSKHDDRSAISGRSIVSGIVVYVSSSALDVGVPDWLLAAQQKSFRAA